MFFDDPKKAAMTIIARRKADGTRTAAPMKAEVTKTEDGALDGRHLAAQDMIAAFHEKSAQKLSDAMSNYIDMHSTKAPATPES